MILTNRTFLAIVVVAGSMLTATVFSTSLATSAIAATGDCGCSSRAAPCETCSSHQSVTPCQACAADTTNTRKQGCFFKRRLKPRKETNCPTCAVECDTCTLKLDHYEEEKTSFKTEQKTVCILPVRFPWEKCCPLGRTNKTRTVNVLKNHKYKCKACGYKWELDALPEPGSQSKVTSPNKPAATDKTPPAPPSLPRNSPASVDPVVAPVARQNLLMPNNDAPQPAFETPPIPAGKLFDAAPPAPAG